MVSLATFGPTTSQRVVRLAILGLVALVAACSGGNGNATPTTTTSSSVGSTTTTTLAVEAQVEAGYRAFWATYLQAADPMNPTLPALAEHAIGQELDTVRQSFADHFGRGEVIRGTLELAPHVTAVTGTTATVTDCYGDATHVFDSATGAQKDPPDTIRYQITATLTLDRGTWKVSSIRKEGQGCAPT